MPASAAQKILLIGIGNRYRNDDGVGVYVSQKLQQLALPHIECVTASGEGTQLIDLFSSAKRVVVVDAVQSSGEPGQLHTLHASQQQIPTAFFHYSTHAFSLAEAVELARELDRLPASLTIYGIEGKTFSAGEGLSPVVEEAANHLIAQLVKELRLTPTSDLQ